MPERIIAAMPRYSVPKIDGLTILRWLAVIPAAILAGWVAHLVLGTVTAVVSGVANRLFSESWRYVPLLLYYAPKHAAFVMAGAKVAPRPLPTAVVLAAAAIILSLMTHILSQGRIGLMNYLHFTAESVGAVIGVAYIYTARRSAIPTSSVSIAA